MTLIEFALVLPFFFVFLAALIDVGIMFFVQHTLQFATREGARLGLVGRTIDDGNGNPLSREASILKTIKDNASVAVKPGELIVSFYPVGANYADPPGWQGTQDAGGPGRYMRVKTQYYFNVPLVSEFVTSARVLLTAQSTYKNEIFN